MVISFFSLSLQQIYFSNDFCPVGKSYDLANHMTNIIREKKLLYLEECSLEHVLIG